LAGAVYVGMDANAGRRSYTIAMQMGDNNRPAIKPDYAEPPRHALTKKKLIAVVQGRFRKQFTRAVLDFPFEPLRQADAAGFARWILHGAAIAAGLEL
jgi:hypothetical protein